MLVTQVNYNNYNIIKIYVVEKENVKNVLNGNSSFSKIHCKNARFGIRSHRNTMKSLNSFQFLPSTNRQVAEHIMMPLCSKIPDVTRIVNCTQTKTLSKGEQEYCNTYTRSSSHIEVWNTPPYKEWTAQTLRFLERSVTFKDAKQVGPRHKMD